MDLDVSGKVDPDLLILLLRNLLCLGESYISPRILFFSLPPRLLPFSALAFVLKEDTVAIQQH